MISIDQQFQKYKSYVAETTLFVDKFWRNLLKEDFHMRDQIGIGKQIVSSYLQVRDVYEKVLAKNPEFVDIIFMNM